MTKNLRLINAMGIQCLYLYNNKSFREIYKDLLKGLEINKVNCVLDTGITYIK